MSNRLFEKGREGFLDGTLDWDTQPFKAVLLDLHTSDTAIKAITAASNATPIVLTSPSHGFVAGDLIVVNGVLGTTSANGTWRVANATANTFELVTSEDGDNSTGNGSYVSGGYAINLTQADTLDKISAARVGTDQALANKTATLGVADADNLVFPGVSGAAIEALAVYRDTGNEATARLVAFIDGRVQVTCAAVTAASATTLPVLPLSGGLSSGSTLVFSNGTSAVLSSSAAAGARVLAVNALPTNVNAGATADAASSGGNLPITPNGGDITAVWDNGPNKIFKL